MGYDIIGDLHGQADKLEDLLQKMEYREQGGAYRHLRIPLMADSDSIPIADSVPGDGGHVARVS